MGDPTRKNSDAPENYNINKDSNHTYEESSNDGKPNSFSSKIWTKTEIVDDDISTLKGSYRNVSTEKSPRRGIDRNGRLVLNKLTLYETKTRYYIVGSNQSDDRFRILKIERTGDIGELNLTDDQVIYTKQEILELLSAIESGNKNSGGLSKVLSAYGIVGFIKFTGGYYISLITKRSVVALIGGHYIYHIDETLLLSIGQSVKVDRNSDEARYINTFQNVDLTKNFYFSYTYDLTNSLQTNLTRKPDSSHKAYNDMFVWNHHLVASGLKCLNPNSDWILPIIHGFVDQSKISVYTRTIFVTLIARRSRHFAGARFLKRGVNDKGYVANDVETEQIVAEMSTTSFHPYGDNCGNEHYTSFLQHRGSIPLLWSQDTTNMSPKPPIELNTVDPFYTAAALHFDDMFHRYGTPCIVLNLVKSKEKAPRESILLDEFTEAITYLNQFLPEDKKIKYIAYDMSRASKSQDENVIQTLEEMAEESIEITGFFHSGPEPYANALKRSKKAGMAVQWRTDVLLQKGVCRTNCIDCLDRTNAAQFVFGKCALGHQLHALGIIDYPFVPFDCDVVNMLTEMYHDHGDTIALQYGGSHLVNTMETYRKINQWSSHSRDMIEGIRRYYSNSFVDAEKQDAINLFLGNYVISKGSISLWELNSDFFLHNNDPRQKSRRRDYRKWWTPKYLNRSSQQSETLVVRDGGHLCHAGCLPQEVEDMIYWIDYYRPRLFTSFARLFAFNMNSTLKYVPLRVTNERFDFSPFKVRMTHIQSQTHSSFMSSQGSRCSAGPTSLSTYSSVTSISRKEQSPSPPPDETQKHILLNPPQVISSTSPRLNIGGVKRWLSKGGTPNVGRSTRSHRRQGGTTVPGADNEIINGDRDAADAEDTTMTTRPNDMASTSVYTIESLVTRMMNPTVASGEMKEYERYVEQFKDVKLDSRIVNDNENTRSKQLTDSDLAYFATYVGASHGSMTRVNRLKVSEADLQTYNSFVSLPTSSKTMRITSTSYANLPPEAVYPGDGGPDADSLPSTTEVARAQAYEKWINTGRFVPATSTTASSSKTRPQLSLNVR